MPRMPREFSESGIYHIVSRGVGQQIIFEDDLDRNCYLKLLQKSLNAEGVLLLAWCLMSNHVHLLIYSNNPPGDVMKRMHIRYALFYNNRHGRIGHLFQDRFKSEAVESEAYLLTVARYIHFNPVKAKLVERCEDYAWSSYSEYTGQAFRCDTAMLLKAFGGVEGFEDYHRRGNCEHNSCEPIEAEPARLPDIQALKLVKEIMGNQIISEIHSLNKLERNAVLRAMKGMGLSGKQVARITGIGYNIVRNCS